MVNDFLTEGPVSPDIISTELSKLGTMKDSGAHSIFLGQVRADPSGVRRVKAIEYSAYGSMVAAESEKIINAIRSEFDDVRSVRIIHSAGIVMAGEISLFVLVSAGHRQQAMEACTKTVNLIKKSLPVWKKEIFEDNSHEWKQDNYA
jgi:molybdopterin synthase catalytic subunit